MFWGLSPALDLQEEFLCTSGCRTEEINILVVGGCDARHILKTLAQAYRHGKVRINFYIMEGCPELITRQILLLSIALEHPMRLGLLEKTRMFLEVYGNSLLRSPTSRYISAKAKRLITLVTNLEFMKKRLPMIYIDKIKYRERDYMEILLKFWETGSTNQFNVCELWEKRVRDHLGERYDSRHGAFDWDYHMRLKDVGGQSVCSHEYKHFRETGVSFTWLETEVCRPNVSLAAGVFTCGERYLHRGYLGDIVTGPFAAYGMDSEDKELLKIANGVNMHRATDISERNVMRMIYELEHGEPLDKNMLTGDKQNNLGMVKLAKFDAKLSDETDFKPLHLIEDDNTYINIDFATIHFMSLSALEHYPEKDQYKQYFHCTFIAHNILKRIQPQVLKMIHEKGIVIFEGRKFMLNMKKECIQEFGKEIGDVAMAGGCIPLGSYDPLKDVFAKFVKDSEKGSI